MSIQWASKSDCIKMRNSLPESLIIVAYGNKFRMQNTSRLWVQVSVEVLMCLCLFFMFFNIIFFCCWSLSQSPLQLWGLRHRGAFGSHDCLLQGVKHKIQYCCFIYLDFVFLLCWYKYRYTYCCHRWIMKIPCKCQNCLAFFSSLKQKRVGIILKRVNSKENFFRPIAMWNANHI